MWISSAIFILLCEKYAKIKVIKCKCNNFSLKEVYLPKNEIKLKKFKRVESHYGFF